MLRLASALALAITLVGTPLAFAQSEEDVMASIENIHGDAEGFFEVFGGLQDAMLFDNPAAIADYVLYPITIDANGETYDVLEQQDLVDNLDTLIQDAPREAIRTQDVADLLVTSEGVGFNGGAVWVSNICLDDACNETKWGIIAINN